MAATVEAAEITEAAEMAAERAATVESEAVKTAAAAVLSKRKVARIPNPAIGPLAPTAICI